MLLLYQLIPLALAFTTSFFAVRKLRNTLRAIVIWCIPVRLRISEQSFHLQTRYTTIASILLVILLTAGLYYGLYRAGQHLSRWRTNTGGSLLAMQMI